MIVTRARLAAFALVAVTALAGAGCGGSEEDDVEAAARDFLTALRDEDFDQACEALSDRSREQIEQVVAQDGQDCAAIFEQVVAAGGLGEIPSPDDVQADSIEIDGDTATVEVEGAASPAQLLKEDGEWKFDSGQAGPGGGGGAAPEGGGAAPPEGGGAAPPEGGGGAPEGEGGSGGGTEDGG